MNRCTPTFPEPKVRRRKADALLWANLDELNATAAAERAQLDDLVRDVGADRPVVWVPLLPSDVHDLTALHAPPHA